MSETRLILEAASKLRASGTPFVCATVMSVRGSSYRRPGARLLATEEGHVAGTVSGGCLEKDLLRTAFWRTRNGSVVVRYDATGCGGEVDVLLERDSSLNLALRALSSSHPCAIATVYRSASLPIGTRVGICGHEVVGDERRLLGACEEAIRTRKTHSISTSEFDALVEAVIPPPHLFVFGAGKDALPIVVSATRLGWDVTVWEPSARVESRDRFAGTSARMVSGDLAAVRQSIDASDRSLAIVMSHHADHDRDAFAMLVKSETSYIGVLGPRHRTAEIAGTLTDPRVRAPVGLDLGAETPEEIALSVTAEMLSVLRGKSGRPLATLPTIHG